MLLPIYFDQNVHVSYPQSTFATSGLPRKAINYFAASIKNQFYQFSLH
jgi:hypothetical protein